MQKINCYGQIIRTVSEASKRDNTGFFRYIYAEMNFTNIAVKFSAVASILVMVSFCLFRVSIMEMNGFSLPLKVNNNQKV